MIEIAPNTLATESLAAKASARPVIPRPAINPFRLTPNNGYYKETDDYHCSLPIDSATTGKRTPSRHIVAFDDNESVQIVD